MRGKIYFVYEVDMNYFAARGQDLCLTLALYGAWTSMTTR